MRLLLLAGCLALFLIIPLKIISYGYLPPDDALRHSAFAVDHRHWNEILSLNLDFHPELDSHPGWHGFLRFLHQYLGLNTEQLVECSVILAFLTFTIAGMIASGSPLAWLCACSLVSVAEMSIFQRFTLGRPMFFSMTALAVLLFIWTRGKPLSLWLESLVVFLLLSLGIYMHPTVWYLWALPFFTLVLCRRWRSAVILGVSLALAMCFAALCLGGWYNVLTMPLLVLKLSLMQDPLQGMNLVGELQPTGGPVFGLLVVAAIMLIKVWRGGHVRDELFQVDFVLVLVAWLLGLAMQRFWMEWGVPALVVWICRQIKSLLNLKLSGLPRVGDTIWLSGFAAAAMYLSLTVDIGGRYTQNLKSPLLTKPVGDFRAELPDDGGILYTIDMTVFYKLYFRMPDAKFRFSTGFEPGFMPPADLKIFRAIQFNSGLLEAYKPWIDKMTPKDRLLLYYPAKPEWPGMEFRQFYSAWIGRKVVASENNAATKLVP